MTMARARRITSSSLGRVTVVRINSVRRAKTARLMVADGWPVWRARMALGMCWAAIGRAMTDTHEDIWGGALRRELTALYDQVSA